MFHRSITRVACVIFVLSLAATACKPKPGAACSAEGKRACAGDDTLVVCEHGKFAAFPCKGSGRCKAEGEGATCDFAGNASGDSCPLEDTGRKTCKPDGKAQLRCASGHLVEVACAGSGACTTNDRGTSECDLGEPELGTACSPGLSRSTCNFKGDTIYGCVSGKWAVVRACRGPNGCKSNGLVGKFCDLGVVDDGDPCEDGEQGRYTCGPARAAVYVCKDRHFLLSKKCDAGKACKYSDAQIDGDTTKGPLVLLPKGADCL